MNYYNDNDPFAAAWLLDRPMIRPADILVSCKTMFFTMFRLAVHFKVFNAVVGLVSIFVMYIVAIWYWPVVKHPDISMQVCSLLQGITIISIATARVFHSVPHDKRKRLFWPEFVVPALKCFIDRLPGNAESPADHGKGMSFFVKIIHRFGLAVFPMCRHIQPSLIVNNIIHEGLASVNP